MNAMAQACRWGALVAVLTLAGGCRSTQVGKDAGASEEPFPVEPYAQHRREAHDAITRIIKEMTPRLRAESAEERARAMKEIAAFVREHLGPHAERVETLYAYADREAGPRYTETMRWEHRTLDSRIRFLEALANAAEPDVPTYRTHLNALLSCMRWHLETEAETIAATVIESEMEQGPVAARGSGGGR